MFQMGIIHFAMQRMNYWLLHKNPFKYQVAVSKAPKLFYFMVNKPKGYICSSIETQEGRGKRAIDLIDPWLKEWSRRNAEQVIKSSSIQPIILMHP